MVVRSDPGIDPQADTQVRAGRRSVNWRTGTPDEESRSCHVCVSHRPLIRWPPPEQARQAAGISLSVLAKHLHCSVQQAARYCQGVSRAPDALYPFLSNQGASSLKQRHLAWMLARRPQQGRPRSPVIEIRVPKGLTPEEAERIVVSAFASAMSKTKEVSPITAG